MPADAGTYQFKATDSTPASVTATVVATYGKRPSVFISLYTVWGVHLQKGLNQFRIVLRKVHVFNYYKMVLKFTALLITPH